MKTTLAMIFACTVMTVTQPASAQNGGFGGRPALRFGSLRIDALNLAAMHGVVRSKQAQSAYVVGGTASTETRANTALVVSGVVMFGVSYLLNIALSGFAVALSRGTAADYAFYGLIPLAGPFMQIASGLAGDWGLIWGLIDGTLQLAGVGLFIWGLIDRRPVETNSASLQLVPNVGPNQLGLTAMGRF